MMLSIFCLRYFLTNPVEKPQNKQSGSLSLNTKPPGPINFKTLVLTKHHRDKAALPVMAKKDS